jgi:hypothetical protein
VAVPNLPNQRGERDDSAKDQGKSSFVQVIGLGLGQCRNQVYLWKDHISTLTAMWESSRSMEKREKFRTVATVGFGTTSSQEAISSDLCLWLGCGEGLDMGQVRGVREGKVDQFGN